MLNMLLRSPGHVHNTTNTLCRIPGRKFNVFSEVSGVVCFMLPVDDLFRHSIAWLQQFE